LIILNVYFFSQLYLLNLLSKSECNTLEGEREEEEKKLREKKKEREIVSSN